MPNLFRDIFVVLTTVLSSSIAVPLSGSNSIPDNVQSAAQAITSTRPKVLWGILKYIGTNYIAHAFTINNAAGYGSFYAIMFGFASLFFPYIGLVTACRSLEQMAILETDPLKRAARAGALCMVVRTKHWKPKLGEKKVWCWQKKGNIDSADNYRRLNYEGLELEYLSQRYVKIHGFCRFPPREPNPYDEYMMVRVPPDFKVRWNTLDEDAKGFKSNKSRVKELKQKTGPGKDVSVTGNYIIPGKENQGEKQAYVEQKEVLNGDKADEIVSTSGDRPPNNPNSPEKLETWFKQSQCEISSLHSIPKAFLALIQLISALPVIWQGRNDKRGYAAYQLTLIPYALMSFINILSSFLTPSYPTVYMIESTTMDEARRRGAQFDGTVGRLCEVEIDRNSNDDNNEKEVDNKDQPDLNFTSENITFSSIDPNCNLSPEEYPTFLEMLWGAVKYIFIHLIDEHCRREIYIGRYHWRKPSMMTSSNVRRIFRRAPKESRNSHLIMVSPFGHPKFRDWVWKDTMMTVVTDLLLTVCLFVPYIVMGIFSQFRPGTSHWYERALVMTWLVFGQVSHIIQRMFWGYLQARVTPLGTKWLNGVLVFSMTVSATYALAAAGGFVVVGSMMWEDKISPSTATSTVVVQPSSSPTK